MLLTLFRGQIRSVGLALALLGAPAPLTAQHTRTPVQPSDPANRPERVTSATPPAASPADAAGVGGPRRWPGPLDRRRVLLPTGWTLDPIGQQVEVGDFPVNIALHPSGRWAAVLHAGQGEHEIVVLETTTRRVISRVAVRQAFQGLCFDPAGQALFASGGEEELVHRYEFREGYLVAQPALRVVPASEQFIPGGLSTSADGRTLYVAGVWGDKLAAIDLAEPGKAVRFATFDGESFPYGVTPLRDGRLAVSLWGAAQVAIVDPVELKTLAAWPTGSHPTEMALTPDGARLFVACANSNSVTVLDTTTGRATETLSTALYPKAPNGCTSMSVALSPDGGLLAVANADTNNLSLFNVTEPGDAKPLGFIPSGWYPTAVRFLADGRIMIAHGKGLTSRANRHGPVPGNEPPRGVREYIAGLLQGTVAFTEPPTPDRLADWTRRAYAASPLLPDAAVRAASRPADSPIPARVGDRSPITHVIYIIKENRTYDQVFGDLPQGNGDAALCLFPRSITPNHHALAEQFVLLDNFYVNSEVSADGHEWSMGAYATDFVEKNWPLTYRPRPENRKLGYPAEGRWAIATPSGGYLWDKAREQGVSYRSYGEFVENAEKPGDPATSRVDALKDHFDPYFRSYDTDYLDVDRTARFLAELARFEREGDMPRLQIVRLPNDHTVGTSRGKPTPRAMLADNDLALGRLVEGVSASRFWPTTAIFVVEDDAQNGPDHVDAHRSVGLVISPYTRKAGVDSTLYTTASMLRTMELILGLSPMSQFDAAATPMYGCFRAAADTRPFAALMPEVDMKETNQPNAWGADLTATMDLAVEDRADDLLFGEIVWKAMRGAESPMPAPVRAAFVLPRPRPEEHDDD